MNDAISWNTVKGNVFHFMDDCQRTVYGCCSSVGANLHFVQSKPCSSM